jgi:sulfate adenylyltransferase subunit 2
MDYYDKLENKSLNIIREAYNQFGKVAILWSMGKDSTTLLRLVRKAFLGKIPFPIIPVPGGIIG